MESPADGKAASADPAGTLKELTMKFRFGIVAAFVLGTVGTALSARAQSFNLDPIHSMVVFRINHFAVSNPFGVFHGPTGTVTVGADGPALDISVPVDKVDMGNEKWETHIKSADFFNAKEFPNLTFKSSSVKKTGDNTWDVTGDLTVHGVTKTITVSVEKEGEATNPANGKAAIGLSTTFKIKRSDYGMNYGVGKGIGDEVTLMINLEADAS
jgi:polyisoprenoid-binding protein YceI